MKMSHGSFYFTLTIIILGIAAFAVIPSAHAAAPTPGPNTTGQVWGRALMPDGATGIAGCQVILLWQGSQVLAQTTTDDSGNFYFTLLQPNDDTWYYQLVVKDGSWGATTTQQFSVMADAATNVQVRVFPYVGSFSLSSTGLSLPADGISLVNLTLSLYDMNGQPFPDGVHVQLTQSSYYPDPGIFIAGASNGTSLTLATDANGQIVLQYGHVPGDTLSREVQIDATCAETNGSKSLNLTLGLDNPNTIKGTVYDATGQTVPFAKVCLSQWNGVGFVGYNSTETGNRSDGSGVADAGGNYCFAVMPAGDYLVNASDAAFANSTRVTVVRGTYEADIVLPMGRGSIKGWVKDNRGNPVAGANVSLLRFYSTGMVLAGTNTSATDGSFSFDNVRYGSYDVQAVLANQTADLPVDLEDNKTSVTLSLLHDVPSPAPTVTPAPGNATAVPTKGPATVTPRPPTPTPPPVTASYLVSTYGVSLAVMVLICVGILYIALRARAR